jgi:RNA polymerase sigma-70 factor (ECF subfamily)
VHNDTDRPSGFEDDQFEEPSSAWSQRCDRLSSGAENKTAAAIGTGLDGYNRTQKRSMADDVSEMLRAWSDGDERALHGLTPIVYAELRRLAQRYMRCERPDHSLQTTALVNEAYIRLVDYKRMRWQNRAHFFAASAQLMRRILVEHARRHNLKRGRGVRHVSFDEAVVVSANPGVDLVALDDAMKALARVDPRKVQVVEMRFFGGLSVEETATVLKVSPVTVRRDWSSAKIWLYRELTGETDDGLESVETGR